MKKHRRLHPSLPAVRFRFLDTAQEEPVNFNEKFYSKEKNRMIQCLVCSKQMKFQALMRHYDEHTEQLQCKTCLRMVPKRNLESHYKIHQLKGAPSKFSKRCCEKEFTNRQHYMHHQHHYHLEKTCKICNTVSIGYNQHKKHMFLVHDKKYTSPGFPCELCGKVFSSRCNLKIHEAVHSGEREYECTWPECGRRFNHISSLNHHYNNHTGEKSQKCNECGEAFINGAGLRHHRLKTGHKLQNGKQVKPGCR